MALDKDVIYLDDWQDLKDYTKQKADEVEKEKENRDVTKDYIGEQISDYEQKDAEREAADIARLEQKIEDISTGGGVDLTPYLKIADAETTYATKSEIPAPVDLTDYAKKSDIPSTDDFVTSEQMTDALSDKATISQVATVDQKVDAINLEPYALKTDIPDVSAFVTESEVDEKVATEIAKVVADAPEDFNTLKEMADYIASDKTKAVEIENAISDLSTNKADKTEIPDLTDYAKKSDIPDVTNFATKDELPVVPTLVSAFTNDAGYLTDHQDLSDYAKKSELPDLTDYAKKTDIPDVSNFATKSELATVESKIPSIEGLAHQSDVDDALALKADKTEIPSIDGLATEEYVTTAVSDKATINQVASVEQKVDAIDLAPYALKTDIPDTSNFATKDELPDLAPYALKTEVPSIEGLVDEEQLNDALEGKANAVDVSNALDEKANVIDVSNALEEKANTIDVSSALDEKADEADLVVAKSEYDELKARFDYLEQLVMEYLPDAQQEKINDGKIDDLSPDNKAVNIVEPMQSVKLPEATVAYTVDVPLKENATVELTSNKYAYINNTSEEPVDVAFGREVPESEAETVANPFVYITGQYDTLTVSNVKISQKDSDVNTINNVIITENNQKTVEITAALADGATITNNSACPVTINNKAVTAQDADPNSVIIVAPNSTVTISGGQYNELTSTVGEDTLYINKAAHIKKLIVTKGNVIVNDYNVEEHIDEIVNDTEYTVTPKTVEVYTQSDWTKASNTPALYEVQNDITTTSRIAPGIFGSNARIKLNGHKVTCSDTNGAFLLRGDSHYIIENGTIDCTVAYGIWLSGAGIVELKDVTIDADTHALYIEKPNGQIITSGNCYFRVKNDDKRYVANYYDATYTGGWTTGFHFGEGTKFEDFDPMNSMGEPSGPVNLLDPGFHTVKTTETIDGVEHDIYTVVKDAE